MIQDAYIDRMRHGLIRFLVIVLFGAVLILGGCKKKTVTPPPPPPPPPPAPTAMLSTEPSTIEAGQSATLTWHTENATDVKLDGLIVDANGSKTVSPGESTTYSLMAKGPGGTQDASARITVSQPPPPPPTPAGPTDEESFAQNIRHISFDYDEYEIRPDQQPVLQADAEWLMQHPNVSFTVEGHCDERGSIEYNMALGDNRATSVKNALIQAGVAPERIHTVSYGKEKPFCTESSEACWSQNRRGYFVYQK